MDGTGRRLNPDLVIEPASASHGSPRGVKALRRTMAAPPERPDLPPPALRAERKASVEAFLDTRLTEPLDGA